ncbi:hypothetical protein PRZ48_012449 [Zasmidium cellare]|uniref:Uncharacterized protein n=1 Tax=Zasmidium cellare TaxID=395010 RepID=A0ABR0E562_ZASCE|nr:hypothetical protein PRZ48_012449 [Zasmidium cellare]
MRTVLRASTITRTTLPRTTLPRTTRTLHASATKPKPATISSTHIEPPTTNADAGNYLTGASTLSLGDAAFLLLGGSVALWLGTKAVEEVKDVVWPEVKWVGKKVVEKDGWNGRQDMGLSLPLIWILAVTESGNP